MKCIRHRSAKSLEAYLETVHMPSKKLPIVRSIGIAKEMKFYKPSIIVAMKNLRSKNYIAVFEDRYIALTVESLSLAQTIYDRYVMFATRPSIWSRPENCR